ncbi:hypothetical protein LCGC14_2028510, partial [marine sediment metagenome]
MYSAYLQEYLEDLTHIAGIEPGTVTLLDETLACFLGIFSRSLGADIHPAEDLLKASIRLLLLDEGISRLPQEEQLNGIHYLIGMGFEQTGELLARIKSSNGNQVVQDTPLDDDHWYRMTLALLHYLAGGHRVQALAVMRRIESITASIINDPSGDEYQRSLEILQRIYSGDLPDSVESEEDPWYQLAFQSREPSNIQERRIQRLATKIQVRRNVVLESLGQEDSPAWLSQRLDV